MKKILLATTILGMTAGFAAAEVKISGSASMGIANDGVDDAFHVYNSGELDFAATVVSDAGVEFGMSTSVSFGNTYSFGDGEDAFDSGDGIIGSPTLTAREWEVLALIGEGLSNRLIARRLGIAEKTVKAHLTSIFSQIGVTDRVQAALWWSRQGGPDLS